MKPEKHIHFIINPNSGPRRSGSITAIIEKEMVGKYKWSISLTERAKHATELALEAVAKNVDAVVAVGGDGTVNEVGKGLIGTDTPLGIIPTGSGNGFARHLKLPLADQAALQRIMIFETLKIDTATLNGIPFLATAGIGFDAKVGWRFSEYERRGLTSYVMASADTFINYKPQTFQLIIDDKELEREAFLINFANAGQYGNNAWIAPSASLTDGMLNVCILKKFPRPQAPEILFRIFNKQIESSKFYEQILARKITVKNPGKIHIDGEPMQGFDQLEIAINPNSLRVIV